MGVDRRTAQIGLLKGCILLLIIVCFSIPYCILMIKFHRDTTGFYNWPLATIKILVYSLFAPLVFVITLSFLKRIKILAYIYGILFVLTYYFALLGMLIYYKYFSAIPNLVLLASIYGEIHTVVRQVYYQLLGPQEFRIIFLLFVAILSTIIFIRLPRTREINAYTKVVILLFLLLIYYGLYKIEIIRWNLEPQLTREYVNNSAYPVAMLGFMPTYYRLFVDDYFHEQNVVPYPGKIDKDNIRDDHLRRLKNANVVIIQVESLDARVVNLRINGKHVMPFLSSLAKRSAYFKNFFAQHSAGGSSDADLSMLTSLLPLYNHVGLLTADYSRIHTLVNVLGSNGYDSAVLYADSGEMFYKNIVYPRIGFKHVYNAESYSGQASGWGAKDLDFFDQSVDHMKTLSEPYFAYLLTNQSHGPFKNYSQSTRNQFKINNTHYSDIQIDYLLSMREVDMAIEQFFRKMRKLGMMENTIVVIYGDHSSHVLDNADCPAGVECIPLIIYHKHLARRVEDGVGSHLDIGPTILDLLDIPEPYNWLGTSLFYDGKKTVLFNDLYIVQLNGNGLQRNFKEEYKPFLDYSDSLVKFECLLTSATCKRGPF
jgi:lipoteichoic acid synthase